MASPSEIVNHVQGQLEAIHDEKSPLRAHDFLVGRRAALRLGRRVIAEEELLVVEGEEGLGLGLYLAPELFQRLRRFEPAGRSGEGLATDELPAFASLVEGVSHFLYLSAAAAADRPVSQLELEAQGEVDKFSAAALHLWGRGLRRRVGELCDRLFRGVTYRPHLDPAERRRYETANQLGGNFARQLCVRFVTPGRLDGFLRELRLTYRLCAEEKLRRLGETPV